MRKIIILTLLAGCFSGCTGLSVEEERRYAVIGIGDTSSPALVETLVKTLKEDPDDLCKAQAAVKLGLLKAVDAEDALIAALEYISPVVREDSVEALGKIGDAVAIKPLIDRLENDKDIAVRSRAAIVLGDFMAEDAVPSLVALLDHKEFRLKFSAYKALKKITGLDIEFDKAKWQEKFPPLTASGKPDYAKMPVELLRQKSESGDADAQAQLAIRYFAGDGVAQDFNETFKWFRKSADQGNPIGQNGLANCYMQGLGTAKDIKLAFELFLKSAEQGYASGQLNAGVCYLTGSGVDKDESEAVKWLTKAADQGSAEAKKALELLKNEK